MESVIVGSLLGAGYMLSKTGKNDRRNVESNNIFKEPSQNNIYDSNHYITTRELESKLVNSNYEKAKDAIYTNIVPPQFNNKIINHENNPIVYLQKPKSGRDDKGVVYSNLTGLPMEKKDFTHINMVPFFGSHVRQITDPNSNSALLENHTGIENFTDIKKESVPLFEPTKDINIQYGTQNVNYDIQNRYVTTMYRQNELPFDQVIVGPGINKGFTAEPSGGFNQDVRAYVIPKTIDELRPISKPQISYKGRVVAGKNVVTRREQIGKVDKYRPDKFYINNSDRYLTTTGAYVKETKRPCIIAKDTNRKNTREYAGSAAPAYKRNDMARSLYKKSTKNQFYKDGPRNAYGRDRWTNETFGDYGKQGFNPGANERDITGKRTHVSNITTIVKAVIAPLLDVMKETRKENVEGNIRQTGNIGTGNGISKPRVWDPNDTTKTTIKETNIHDVRTGNMSTVVYKGTVKDPNDVARTTIKETNIHDVRTGHLKGPNKLTVYDPNDIARKTIKETNIHDVRTGNIGGLNKDGGYMTNPNEAPNTNRQFTSDYEYEGNPDTNLSGGGTGYMTNPNEAPNTNRQFTSDYEYEGTADSYYKKPTTYDAEYNARLNEVREGTLLGREPTQNNVKLFNGRDDLGRVEFKKIEGDIINTRELNTTKVYNSIQEMKPCSTTKERHDYDSEYKIMDERINPELLKAFRENPYTHPLSSYAFS